MYELCFSNQDLRAYLGGASFEAVREEFDAQGYVVFERVLSPDQLARLRDALTPFLAGDLRGRNDFEGLLTNRVYALLAKSPVFSEIIAHPLALAFVEADLGRNALLSACLAIQLWPGESVQPWHFDDSHYRWPRPRPSLGVSAFWAIDETTTENGATEIIPGSHTWPDDVLPGSDLTKVFSDRRIKAVDEDPAPRDDAVQVELPAGSLMLTKGTLWHRGGANRSQAPRLIITPQYCPAWTRQLENMMASLTHAQAAELPERVQELVGYSIHEPFMGYVDGMHPNRLLR